MLSFENDYNTGAHELILKKLAETNLETYSGYGNDDYCEQAIKKIKEACHCPEAEIYFLVGGTQTNSVVISTTLKDYEGVLSANTGHINVHEAGAIEYTGHKVLGLPHHNGKIDAKELKEYMETFYSDETYPHMVFPGMIYISQPTEYGTLYTKQELKTISELCHTYNIPLFIDGARLGYALASSENNVSLKDLAELSDIFYIGGTKVGALCGEAVVFTKHNAPKHFQTMAKQHGALLAKGRLLGIQFDTLFTDNLYLKISKHAINMAEELKHALQEKGYKFYFKSPTNQQFIILENTHMKELSEKVKFSFWEKIDENHTAVRFVTCRSTTLNDIEELKKLL